MSKVAIVTGGSSGIGKATAEALSARGFTVYEFSRSGKYSGNIKHITADVSDESAVKDAIAAVHAAEGHIDVLINNAGYGISGCLELTDNKSAQALMDVNFMGVVNTCKAITPIMRAQKSGTIINLGSVAGALAIPFQGWYSVSKAAIAAYTDTLRNELRPWGIGVCTVLPGDINTGFTAARQKSIEGDDIYGGRIEKAVSSMEHDEINGIPAASAGRFIAKLALKNQLKPRYIIGNKYRLFMFLAAILPNRMVSFIISKMY